MDILNPRHSSNSWQASNDINSTGQKGTAMRLRDAGVWTVEDGSENGFGRAQEGRRKEVG